MRKNMKQTRDRQETIIWQTQDNYRQTRKIKMTKNHDKLEENERHKEDNHKIYKHKTNKKQTQD